MFSQATRWFSFRSNRRGQALVEFTLTFVLLLVIAWIPADFGLAFFTGQQIQNAAREGARIAAADPRLVTKMGAVTVSCTAPCSGQPDVVQATAARLSNVLIKTTNVTLTYPASGAGTCNQMLTVQVQGTYNYFFYQLLHLLGITRDLNTTTITRVTSMRYEHQTPCNPWS